MKPIFIIEHLEPRIWRWCEIEYESISKIVGKENVWLTNIKIGGRKLARFGKVFRKSVRELNIDLKKACVLDPFALKTLAPKEAKEFRYFIFGGILGDEKLNGRTKKELTRFLQKAHKRNIGRNQFSTDNAVYVTSEIVNGKRLNELKFKDNIEIKINSIESTILPYRYPLVKGKPRISLKLITYLKNQKVLEFTTP